MLEIPSTKARDGHRICTPVRPTVAFEFFDGHNFQRRIISSEQARGDLLKPPALVLTIPLTFPLSSAAEVHPQKIKKTSCLGHQRLEILPSGHPEGGSDRVERGRRLWISDSILQ